MEIVSQSHPEATISGSYGYAWKKLWNNFLYFFLVAVIVGFAQGPASAFEDADTNHGLYSVGLYVLAAAYWLLVLPVIRYGGDLLYLRGIRDEKMELQVLIEGFNKNYLNIILANFLTVVIIGAGLVLLIIPGIILACRLAFVPFLVMDKGLDAMASIETSWEMTKGHGWTIFGMALLAILVFIAGLICFLVGAFISVMWIWAAFAALYHAVDKT